MSHRQHNGQQIGSQRTILVQPSLPTGLTIPVSNVTELVAGGLHSGHSDDVVLRTGADGGDAVGTHLSGRGQGDAVRGLSEGDGVHTAVHGIGQAGIIQRIRPRRTVGTGGSTDHQGCHTGIRNDDDRTFVETNGIGIIRDVAGSGGLIIGHDQIAVLPHLSSGGELHAIGLVGIKSDGGLTTRRNGTLLTAHITDGVAVSGVHVAGGGAGAAADVAIDVASVIVGVLTGGRDGLGIGVSAHQADVDAHAILTTGGVGGRRNFIGVGDLTHRTAHIAVGVAGIIVGVLAGGGDGLGVAVAADRAGIGAHTCRTAGGGSGDLAPIDMAGRHTGGTAHVAGGIASVIVGVGVTHHLSGGEIVHRAGSTLIQGQRTAGRGGIASKAVGAVTTQVSVDAGSFVAHVDKLVGAGAGNRPLAVVGQGGQQSTLILGAVTAGIDLRIGVIQCPVVAILGDVPHRIGGRILNATRGGSGLHVVETGSGAHLGNQCAAVVEDEVIALGQRTAVRLKGVVVDHTALFTAGIQSIQGHPGRRGQRTAHRIVGGLVGGLVHLIGAPAQEGLTIGHRTAVSGQGDSIAGIGGLGKGDAAGLSEADGYFLTLTKVDTHRHVGRGRNRKDVTIASHGSGTAEDGIAGGRIAGLGGSGDDVTLHRHSAVAGVIGAGGDGVTGRGTRTGGRVIIGRYVLAKQLESQLGIVHEHVAGAGDGLYRIVTTQLPSVYGIFLHPLEQNLSALHDTGGTPHIIQSTVVRGTAAPADVDVQHDTGRVATYVLSQLVGVVKFATLTVGGVSTRGVFAHRSGTQHHNVGLTLGVGVTAAVTLTVRPHVLAVPGLATIPRRTDGLSGIERRNGAAAVFTVGVLKQASGGIVGRGIVQIIVHQLMQRVVQRTIRHAVRDGRAGQRCQLGIRHAVIGIEILRHRRQEGGELVTLTPVVDVFAGIDVIDRRRLCRHHNQGGQQADQQHQRAKPRQRAFGKCFHTIASLGI